jgi:hypothetical protein
LTATVDQTTPSAAPAHMSAPGGIRRDVFSNTFTLCIESHVSLISNATNSTYMDQKRLITEMPTKTIRLPAPPAIPLKLNGT